MSWKDLSRRLAKLAAKKAEAATRPIRIDWDALAAGDVVALARSMGEPPEDVYARLWGRPDDADDRVEARIKEIMDRGRAAAAAEPAGTPTDRGDGP